MKVQVKWQKNTYDVEIDQDQPPSIFKQQMFSLTGVPAERQKISVKGGMLKDDADWHKLGIKPGAKLMMMGTADKVPEAPTTAQGESCPVCCQRPCTECSPSTLPWAVHVKHRTCGVMGSACSPITLPWPTCAERRTRSMGAAHRTRSMGAVHRICSSRPVHGSQRLMAKWACKRCRCHV